MRDLDEITDAIIGESIAIHRRFGSALYESVYEAILEYRLVRRGLTVARQFPFRLHYEGLVFDEAFRIDLLVEGLVVVELKSVEKVSKAHHKQVLSYVRLVGAPVGLLINFGEPTLKEGVHRVANDLPPSASPRLRVNNRRNEAGSPVLPGRRTGGIVVANGNAEAAMANETVASARRVHFEGITPILPVLDVQASIEYFTGKLGFKLEWDYGDGFACVSRERCTLFLCEGGQGHPGTWVWVGVEDAARLHEEYRASGAKVRHPPTNYSWAYEMQVEDLDGNVLRMGSEPLPDTPVGEWLDMHGRRWTPLGNEQWTLNEGT